MTDSKPNIDISLSDLIGKRVNESRSRVGKRGRGRGRGGRRGRGRGRGGKRFDGGRRSFRDRDDRRRDSGRWEKNTDLKTGRDTRDTRDRRTPRYNRETVKRREPETFTTKSGLQVAVGVTGNPDLQTSVQIKGLHTGVSSDDLREILSKYGTVKFAYVVFKEDGTSNRIGRGCFYQEDAARKAAGDLDNATIDGIDISATWLGESADNYSDRRRGDRSRRESSRDRDRGRSSSRDVEMDRNGIPVTPFNPLARR